jgi:hypothetical protein
MIKVLANWSPRYHSCFIRHGIQRCPKNPWSEPFLSCFSMDFRDFRRGIGCNASFLFLLWFHVADRLGKLNS